MVAKQLRLTKLFLGRCKSGEGARLDRYLLAAGSGSGKEDEDEDEDEEAGLDAAAQELTAARSVLILPARQYRPAIMSLILALNFADGSRAIGARYNSLPSIYAVSDRD